MSKNGVLEGLVVGWEDVEPIMLACIAAKINLILRGRHGTSKTIFAKLVAQALGGTYRHYDATKDDMVSVAGIPNPEDLKKGVLSFSKHDRAIWDADYISIDELTRAPRESQNMWLEILEEKTCTGFPLKYRMALATMNPATYNATYRLDEALLDRFAALVDVPEIMGADVNPQDIYEIVKLNINGKRGARDPQKVARLGEAINAIAEYYHAFAASPEIVDSVCNYAKVFGQQLLMAEKGNNVYISPRRFIHLANCLIACAAYYKFAQLHGGINLTEGVFCAGAQIAATHVISSPLNISAMVIKTCHEKAKPYLKNLAGNQADKLLLEINKEKNFAKKIDLFKKHLPTINGWSSSEVGGVFDSITSLITEASDKMVDIAKTSNDFSKTQLISSKQLGEAIDKIKDICETITREQDKYSIAMRVAAKNNLGAIMAQRFKIMQGLAAFVSNNSEKTSEVYTYAQVMANKSVADNGIWDGNLLNGSLAETVSAILKGIDDSIPRV